MYMNSARTYGKGHFVMGLQGLSMNREYPISSPAPTEENYTSVLGLPVTVGITDVIDLSGVLYYFDQARPFLSKNDVTRLYGDESGGLGSVSGSIERTFAVQHGERCADRNESGCNLRYVRRTDRRTQLPLDTVRDGH